MINYILSDTPDLSAMINSQYIGAFVVSHLHRLMHSATHFC